MICRTFLMADGDKPRETVKLLFAVRIIALEALIKIASHAVSPPVHHSQPAYRENAVFPAERLAFSRYQTKNDRKSKRGQCSRFSAIQSHPKPSKDARLSCRWKTIGQVIRSISLPLASNGYARSFS